MLTRMDKLLFVVIAIFAAAFLITAIAGMLP